MTRWTRSHRLLLCGCVAALLYLTGLGRPALWEPDEGRYAEIAREMLLRGDYVTPRNDWVRYFEKPPLVYWATAASLELFGPNEFAVRLQAALFSVGQVVITAALGEAMFGAAVGMLAALALALSPLFFTFARFATPDPALAFWMTAGLAAFFIASRTPHFGGGTGRLWMLASAAALALGTLAKGPVALLLAGGIALAWLTLERRTRDVRKMPWLACILVFFAIAAPWFVIAARRNPGFLEFFFIHEHLQRYLENAEHGWGPWFFIPVVIGGAWPWCFFAPLGVFTIRRGDRNGEPPEDRSALHFLMLWFAVIFVFFSIPRSKLGEYLLPGFPPLAIIAGCGIAWLDRVPASTGRRLVGWLLALNIVLAVAATTIALPALRLGVGLALVEDPLTASFALVLAAVAAFWLIRRRPIRHAFVLPLALGSLALLLVGIKARGDAASRYTYRSLARTIEPLTTKGCLLASYRHYVQSLPFYTASRELLVGYRGELAPFADEVDAKGTFISTYSQLNVLWSSDSCVILITNRGDLAQIVPRLKPTPSLLGCEGKKFALYNRHVMPTPALPRECQSALPALLP
jgi:4-amino-4-deoxy-L-arabinose transferase-like glycosyltransferase